MQAASQTTHTLSLKIFVNRWSCLNFWRSSVLKIRFIPDLWHCKHCILLFCIALFLVLFHMVFSPDPPVAPAEDAAGVHVCSAHPKSQQPLLAMIYIFREAIPSVVRASLDVAFWWDFNVQQSPTSHSWLITTSPALKQTSPDASLYLLFCDKDDREPTQKYNSSCFRTSHRCEWSYECVIWNNTSLLSLQPLRVNILHGDVRWKTTLWRRALTSGDGARLAHVSGMGFYVEHMELLKWGIFLIWPLLFVEANVVFFHYPSDP